MLFNSGTPNLVSRTRLLAGDPDDAGGLMWTEQQVKDTVNAEYVDMVEMSRQRHGGTRRKTTYRDATADQIYYNLPADFVAFYSTSPVQVSADGAALTATRVGEANQIFLEPQQAEVALEAYYREVETAPRYVFLEGTRYGIVAPPTSAHAGTNTLRLIYEAEAVDLASDSDEPIFPKQHHELICYRAAMVLRVSKDLPINDLAALMAGKMRNFLVWTSEQMQMIDNQIPAAGRIRQSPQTRTGTVRRT